MEHDGYGFIRFKNHNLESLKKFGRNLSGRKREAQDMAVKIVIDRKVKRGKEADFAELLGKLRSKAIFSKVISQVRCFETGMTLKITLWSQPGRVLVTGKDMKRLQKQVRSMPELRN
jgi:hypothetical protein